MRSPAFHRQADQPPRPCCGVGGVGKVASVGREIVGPRSAFTLLELLVVIGIIAVLATISFPAMKGLGRSNAIAAANRQLLDDIGYARQRAMSGRTTVYVLFVPPVDWPANSSPATLAALSPTEKDRMLTGQFTSYALYTDRLVGEQPGRKNPRYLSKWKSLPDGTLIATKKFLSTDPLKFETNSFPYPTTTNVALHLPYIAFDSQGRLTSGHDETIPLLEGSVFYERDASGLVWAAADVREKTKVDDPVNSIVVNWLTGRAKLERPEIQ